MDTLFRVVWRVHQHGQAVLHTGQLGGNYCKVLDLKKDNIFDNTVMDQKFIILLPLSDLNIISLQVCENTCLVYFSELFLEHCDGHLYGCGPGSVALSSKPDRNLHK